MKKRLKIKKKLVIIILIFIIIVTTTSVYGYRIYNYNKFYSKGQESLKNDDYNAAETNFKSALNYNYKMSEEINKNLTLIEVLKSSKQNYENAVGFLKDAIYLDAIESFKKVTKEDEKRYKDSETKVEEAIKLYVTENMDKAKEEVKNNKFDSALGYLEGVIKFDSKNEEAIKLKNEISEKKENALKPKKINTKINANAKVSTSNNSSNVEIVKNSEYPKIIQINGGIHIIENKQQDDGHLGGILINSGMFGYSYQPNSIYFKVFQGGTMMAIPYKAIFHLKGKDVVYNGKTSNDLVSISAEQDVVPPGFNVKVDFTAIYNGKSYNFSNSFTRMLN